MNEFIGLAYYGEVPAVIFDVQRTGPSTGMPTRTQQGDLMMCAYASHGDTRHICLYPSDPREAFEFAVKAFDLADRFQTPVFVLSDLDIGMNDWMVPKLTWDDSYRPDRGKVLSADELDKVKTFYRYLDPGWRRHPVSHAAGHASEGRVLHARLGAQPVWRLHRGRRGVHRSHRSHGAQDSGRDARGAGAAHQDAAGRQDGPGHRRRLPRGVRRGDGPARQGRHGARLHARARVPVRRRRAQVPRMRTRSTSSSSRIATRSCSSLLMLETGVHVRSSSRCATTAASR